MRDPREKLHKKKRPGGRRAWALMLAFVLGLSTLTSCGEKEKVDAPELLTPIALTDSYRPVQRRDIGEVKLLSGVVVPESYPVFSESPFDIYELKVYPGDHVEEGDVIATGDTRALDSSIRNLNAQIEMMTLQRNTKESISKKEEEKLKYLKAAAQEVGFTEEAKDYDVSIRLEQENRRYDLENLDASIKNMRSNLAKLKEEKEKLVFTAPHSGEITFLKDTSSVNNVAGNENIAVISDYSDLYIEVPDVTTRTFEYTNYQDQYIMVDGVRHKLQSYAYSTAELSLAENRGAYPPIRFRAENFVGTVGATIPLYFSNTSCKDVLAISNDSVYREGDFAYCYVLGADGQRERRDIETGQRDLAYTEILSGLTEGEAVFYDNKSVLPVNYKEYTVKTKDYVETYSSKYVSELLTDHDIYIAPWDGTILEANVKGTDTVEEGQELFKVKIPVKRGELADVKNQITDSANGYNEQMKNFSDREKELKAAIEEAGNPRSVNSVADIGTIEQNTTDGDTVRDQATDDIGEDQTTDTDEPASPTREELEELRDSLYLKERLTLDLDILKLNRSLAEVQYTRQKESLNTELNRLSGLGTDGEAVITARESGSIGQYIPSATEHIYADGYLFTISSSGKKLLRVSMTKSRRQDPLPAARPGQIITFTTDTGSFTGKCVAANGDPGRMYLFTRDGKEHITSSQAYDAGSTEQFFVEIEDESFYEDMPSVVASYEGCLVQGGTPVPAKAIYTEKDSMTEKTSVFVWKVTENGLVKEEVTVLENTQFVDEKLVLSGLKPGDVIAVE